MNIEFLILVYNYFQTLQRRDVIWEWVFPLILVIIGFILLFLCGVPTVMDTFNNNVVKVLAVLIGFTITIITLVVTGNSPNLTEIREKETNVKINGKNITLYKHLLINYTYSVIVEIFLIIFCLIYPLLLDIIDVNYLIKYLGFSILLFFVLHILLLSVRNLTNFCFIIIK